MLRTRLAILATGVALAACAADEPAAPTGPLTAHEQLARGTVFLFAPEQVALHATLDVAGAPPRTLSLPVAFTGGVVVATTDEQDRLVLSELTLNHQAALIPTGDLTGDGIGIGDLVVRMRAPVALGSTVWSDDGEVALANAGAGLGNVAWTIDTEAGTFGYDRMISLELSTMVLPADNRIELLLSASTTAFVWTWGPFTVSMDLQYSIDGAVERAAG